MFCRFAFYYRQRWRGLTRGKSICAGDPVDIVGIAHVAVVVSTADTSERFGAAKPRPLYHFTRVIYVL